MRISHFSRFAIVSLFMACSCVNKEIPKFTCADSDLTITEVSTTDASTCSTKDAQVEVAGSLGTGPYEYSMDAGPFQPSPVFTNLWAGTYTFTVKDSKGCTRELPVSINASNTTLATSFTAEPDAQCFSPHDGSITVTLTGGMPPYQLKIDGGAFGASTTFNNLPKGIHAVVVRDAENCTLSLSIAVSRGDTGISYSSQIQPILNEFCNSSGCHGSGNGSRSWTSFSNVTAKAGSIKSRTSNGTMPPPGSADLTSEQIQLIACWVEDGVKNN